MTDTIEHNHIVKLPFWVFIIRVIQGVLTLILFGLACYGLSRLATDAWGLTLFTCLFTALFLAYYFVSTLILKVAFTWIAVLVLEALCVVFWLCSFATLANLASLGNVYYTNDYYYYYSDDTYYNVVCAGLTFALFQWILFTITLVMLALAIHRHRTAGHPAAAGRSTTATHSDAPIALTDAEKANITTGHPTTGHPTTGHAQQPYYPPPGQQQQQQQPPSTYVGSEVSSAGPSPYPPAAAPVPYGGPTPPPATGVVHEVPGH